MGARHKMARTLLTVMAAAALGLACAESPPQLRLYTTTRRPTRTTTATATSEQLRPYTTSHRPTRTTTATATSEAPFTPEPTLTTTIGPQTFNLDNITGTWLTYIREGIDGPYRSLEMEVLRQTPEEIAVYEQSWLLRKNSTNETNSDSSDSINWQNVHFLSKMKFEGLNDSFTFLMEVSTDPSYIRTIELDWKIDLFRVKITNEQLIFRQVNGGGREFNFYRTLPDLTAYARCENFDVFDASEAFDNNSLVGTWTTNTRLRGLFFNLRVTRKTAEEISAYREDLRNTTVEEADVDWMKVRLQAELFSVGNEVRALGLIEELDKPGSIRVIPLKETWDRFGTRGVDNWFTSQNLLIKKDDGFLAVRNCDNPWQKAYFSRRPQMKTRKVLRKPANKTSGKKLNSSKFLTKAVTMLRSVLKSKS